MDAQGASPLPVERGSVTTSTTFQRAVIPRVFGANLVAAGIVYIYGALVSPTTGLEPGATSYARELMALAIYIAIAAAVGMLIGKRNFAPVATWLDEQRQPSGSELEITLGQPLRQSRWVFVGWAVGGMLFGGLHMTPNPYHFDPGYGLFVAAVAVLGGLAAAMLSYLLIEQTLRPIFALALEQTAPIRPATLGVRQRFIISWALGSGVVFVATRSSGPMSIQMSPSTS